jgi:hypothetical protein
VTWLRCVFFDCVGTKDGRKSSKIDESTRREEVNIIVVGFLISGFIVMLKAARTVCQTRVHSCIHCKQLITPANSVSTSSPPPERYFSFPHDIARILLTVVMPLNHMSMKNRPSRKRD